MSCAAIAAGCSVYAVKRGGSGTLVVTLTETNPMQLCTGGGICNDGACDRPDAGTVDDGGVSVETIERCAEAGVDSFVAGSSVFGADKPDDMITELRRLATGPT